MDVWPFSCQFPGCGRKFKRKDVFKNHQRTHAKDFSLDSSSSLMYSGLNVASSVTSLSSPGSSPGMTSTNSRRLTSAVLEEVESEGREDDDNNDVLDTQFDSRGERLTTNPDKLSSMNQEELSVQRNEGRRTRSSSNVMLLTSPSSSLKTNQNHVKQLRSPRSSFASKVVTQNQVVIEQDDDEGNDVGEEDFDDDGDESANGQEEKRIK